jgi:acyl-CoA synthetase (AMP-forming)/AMP-acid ligase II
VEAAGLDQVYVVGHANDSGASDSGGALPFERLLDAEVPRFASAFTGDWLHTGDLGYFDEDGFLFIVSRKKELIIRGGYNVYPSETENVLLAHPAVADAAVVGIPDPRIGEEVMA